ncbi:MAG: YlmC/YmxH family sporulation protein [Clostridia bacterium]|nr:YlmC/YmxH family sporulation protein [Clostridia bacterium]
MSRGIDFKQKEVISLNEGKILGFVVDVQADFENGEIHSIIVAKTGKIFGSISSKNNITIPWEKIKKIGEDVILVEI